MNGKTSRRLRALAAALLICLLAAGCSSAAETDTSVLGADETSVETTTAPETTAVPETTVVEATTTAPTTTEAATTTEVASEGDALVEVLTTFLHAMDEQDYTTVLGLLHPDYAGSIQADIGSTWSAFWVFQTLFDYDGLSDPECEVGPAVTTCTQVVTDRLARLLDYEFTTSFIATFEDGLIRTAAISASDEGFFIPLLVWASTQPDTPCLGAGASAYEGLTSEEIEESRKKPLTEFDLDEPIIAGTVECVVDLVDNAVGFAALPTSPPLPSS